MSTLKVNSITHSGNSGTDNLALDNSGNVKLSAAIQDSSGNNSSTPAQIQRGRAKLWVRWNANSVTDGTCEIRDSYNVTSVTYNSTGDYTVNYAVTMANNDYLAVSMMRLNSRTQGVAGQSSLTTTQCLNWRSYDGSGNLDDRNVAGLIVFGDL
tara:strand:+ start:207 stop:668 length:462 start_codon:yes stop_codon:yes gene_type:complete